MKPTLFSGVTYLFRGLRQGDQRTLLMGGAVIAWVLLRRDHGRTLVHRSVVRDGSSLVIHTSGGDPVEVVKRAT